MISYYFRNSFRDRCENLGISKKLRNYICSTNPVTIMLLTGLIFSPYQ